MLARWKGVVRISRDEQIKGFVIRWTNTIQFILNYATIALASIAAGVMEYMAQTGAGNQRIMGVVLALASIATITVAVLTGNKWNWLAYGGQLVIGIAQVWHSEWNLIALSLASLPVIVASVSMQRHVLVSLQRDKVADREYEDKVADRREKARRKHEKEMAQISTANQKPPDAVEKNGVDLEARREAQRLRDQGGFTLVEIGERVGKSRSWVGKYTTK